MSILTFKISQFFVGMVYLFFISGFRKRSESIPLINPQIILLLKLTYAIPIGFYFYVLWNLAEVLFTDLLALLLITIGTIIVVKSRLDLANAHTWIGYGSKPTTLITHGIFAYIRHPLYLGIYMAVIGTFFTVVPHAPTWISIVVLVGSSFPLYLITVAVLREDQHLERLFGELFLAYKKQVHPFLPLRKFRG